ncbi:MAG: hypothetical protein R2754_00090, partial [Microthrixaceae bacterium]
MSTDVWLRRLQLRAALILAAYQASMGGLTFVRPEVTMGAPAWGVLTDVFPARWIGAALCVLSALTVAAILTRSRVALDVSLMVTGITWASWALALIWGAFTLGPGGLSGAFGYGLV